MKRSTLTIMVLFLFSFLLRLFFMNDGLFHHDSIQFALAVEKTVETGIIHPAVGAKYGLVVINALLFEIPYHLFGAVSSELTITLSTMLFASLAVVFLYLFMRELGRSKFHSISAALLFSVAPLFLSITTYAKSHGLSLFLVTLSAYALVRALKRSSFHYAIIASFTFGMILHVRPSDIVFGLPLLIIYLWAPKLIKMKGKEIRWQPRFLVAIIVPSAFLALLYLMTQWHFFLVQATVNPIDPSLFNLFFALHTMYQTLTVLGSLFLLVGIFFLWRSQKHLLLLLLAWFLPTFLYHASISTFSPRLLAVSVVPLMIITSHGIEIVYKKKNPVGILLLIILALSMLFSVYPILDYRKDHSAGKDLALQISSLTEEDAVIILTEDGPFIEYYAGRETMAYSPGHTDTELQTYLGDISILIEEGRPVYISEVAFIYHKPPSESMRVFFAMNETFKMTAIDESPWENFHKASLEIYFEEVYLFRLEAR